MYVLERSVLDLIPPGRRSRSSARSSRGWSAQGLTGCALDGYWMDIGTPERYLQASWDILEGRVATRVEPTAPACWSTPAPRSPPGRRSARARWSRAGCRVGAGAEVRELGPARGLPVGEGARVSGSILAAGAEVAAGASLEGAVVGRG